MNVLATVTNNISTDQRLHKIGKTLSDNGYSFLLIGSSLRGKPLLKLPFSTKRLNVIFKGGFLFYAEFNFRLFIELLFQTKKNTILLSNDLDTLLPMFIIHKLYNIPLVYDSHEIFSELPSLKENSIQKKVWKFLESYLVPKVEYFYTVSQGYANWFSNEYKVNPKIIRNVPFRQPFQFNSNKIIDKPYLIYQGAINEYRGIDVMIEAMQEIEIYDLIIAGEGPLLESYKSLSVKLSVQNKIRFLGRLNPDELRQFTQNAFCGISLEQAKSLSYKLALPNKMFDYIHANIPVIATEELPEVVEIVQKYKIGVCINPNKPSSLVKAIEAIEAIEQNRTDFVKNLENARNELCWENQEEELLSIFSEATQHK